MVGKSSEPGTFGSPTKDALSNDHACNEALYSECRTEARAHAALRKKWLQKAAKAYVQKEGHLASHYADEVAIFAIL